MLKKDMNPMSSFLSKFTSPIFTFIKDGWEVVKDIFSIVKKVGNSKQINVDNCEISDLSEINSIFNEFISLIEPKVNKIEESIQDEMYYYLDELIEFLNNNKKLKEKGIRINIIERKIEKIKCRISDNLKKEISKNISLDNYECKQIIKMIPGERKTNKMNELFELTLNKAIENLVIDTKQDIEDIMDYIEYSIQEQLENLDRNIKNQEDILNVLDSNSEEYIEEKESIISTSILLSEVSDYLLYLLKIKEMREIGNS